MKSKRVAKLLACMLAASMCATPVFASSADTTTITQDNQDGQIGMDFAKTGINVEVSVPTEGHLRVNPLTTLSGSQTAVKDAQIATADLKIINRTWAPTGTASNNEGIPVIVTAYATAQKNEGVKIVYNKAAAGSDVFDANSDEKNALMKLQSGTLSDISGNATYGSGSDVYVTELGSRIKFKVNAPTSVSAGTSNITIPDANAGLGAMAIIGEATVNAPWQEDDLAVEFVYNIKASKAAISDTQPTASYTSGKITVAAANLNKASVTGVAVQDPVADSYGFFPVEFAEDAIVTKADGSIELTVPTDLQNFFKEDPYKSKPQDLLIQLSDGRVIVTTATF